jgi:hypothetical protein
MTPGERKFKRASCNVVIPQSVPPHLRDQVREIVSMHSEDKGKGHATELLEGICTEADVNAMTLMLMVRAYGDGMSELSLCQWYGKHGFFIAGSEPCIMLRAPVIKGLRH